MRSKKALTWTFSIMLAVMWASVCTIPPASAQEVTNIKILGSKFGRTTYIQAFALAQIMNKNSKWLKATAQETLGSADNIKLADRSSEVKKTTLLVSSYTTLDRARKGGKGFNKKHDDLRMVAVTLRAGHFFASLKPDIKTYKDMAGKKVAIGLGSSPHGWEGLRMIEDCFEFQDKKDLKIIQMPAPNIAEALVDRIADVGFMTINPAAPAWMPDQSLESLRSRHKVYPIPLPYDLAKRGTDKGKYNFLTLMNMPADTLYKGQPETPMPVAVIGFAAYTALPDDVVYEVLRILYKHQPKFVAYHQLMKVIIPDKLGEGPFGPEELHSGAVKFFKEHGLKMGM